MKILITGASGYLGSQLVKFFSINNNNEIIAVVRSSSSTSRLVNLFITIVKVDNETQLNNVFNQYRPDVVINTVALYGRKNESLPSLIDANINYPNNLLSLAKKYNSKAFIHTGTSLPDNVSAYALTKNTFVKLTEFQNLASIQFINLELEHFYGPGDDENKFTSYVIRECLSHNNLNLTAGTQRRDFIYIDDVTSAYQTILDKLDVLNSFETISIGSGKAPTIKNVVEMIHECTRSKSQLCFGAIPMRNNELMYSCANIEKMMTLGWKKQHSLKSGILKTISKDM